MTHLIAFLVLIGVLITAHELGHFIVAKLCGVKVHTFSIGFGRALLSKTIGETEYRIAMLPLGGYVRLHGIEREFGDLDDPSPSKVSDRDPDLWGAPSGDEYDGEVDDPDAGRALQDKPAWMRVLIFIAGPAMNLILPFALLPPLFLSADAYNLVIDNMMGAVDEGLPAYRSGLRAGDRILSIDGEEIYAFWQVQQKVSGYEEGAAPLSVKVQRPTEPQPIEVSLTPERVASTERFSGPTARPLRIGFQPASLAPDYVISDLEGAFARAGGQNFDRVIAVQDQPIRSHSDFLAAVGHALRDDSAKSSPLIVTVERSRALDERWQLLRDAQNLTLSLDIRDLSTRFGAMRDHAVQAARARAAQDTSSVRLDHPTLIANALGVRQASACVSSINPQSAAMQVLQVGDCLLSVDGAHHSLAAFINQRLRYHPELPKHIKVLRQGREVEATLKLREETHQDPLAGEMKFWELGFTLAGLSRSGAMISPELIPNKERLKFSWAQTTRRVSSELTNATHSLSGLFSGRVKATQLSGPITIFYLAGRQAEAGWIPFINLMVLISISIALLNLLPIPGLDGGHILFAGFEMITRRPLPAKYRAVIQVTGVIMIFLLMLFVLGSDLIRMWRLSSGG